MGVRACMRIVYCVGESVRVLKITSQKYTYLRNIKSKCSTNHHGKNGGISSRFYSRASTKVSTLHILHRINKSFANTDILHKRKQTKSLWQQRLIPINIYFVYSITHRVCVCVMTSLRLNNVKANIFVEQKRSFRSLSLSKEKAAKRT